MTRTTVYNVNIHPEPGIGTAVVDDEGVIWQHLTEQYWVRPRSGMSPDYGVGGEPKHRSHLEWPMLLVARGQVREVWRPEEPKTLAAPAPTPYEQELAGLHPTPHPTVGDTGVPYYPPGVRGFQPTSEILEELIDGGFPVNPAVRDRAQTVGPCEEVHGE